MLQSNQGSGSSHFSQRKVCDFVFQMCFRLICFCVVWCFFFCDFCFLRFTEVFFGVPGTFSVFCRFPEARAGRVFWLVVLGLGVCSKFCVFFGPLLEGFPWNGGGLLRPPTPAKCAFRPLRFHKRPQEKAQRMWTFGRPPLRTASLRTRPCQDLPPHGRRPESSPETRPWRRHPKHNWRPLAYPVSKQLSTLLRHGHLP